MKLADASITGAYCLGLAYFEVTRQRLASRIWYSILENRIPERYTGTAVLAKWKFKQRTRTVNSTPVNDSGGDQEAVATPTGASQAGSLHESEDPESSVSGSENESPRPMPDAVSHHWVDTHVPARLRIYLQLMRMDRPIGYRLLWLPCLWGIFLSPLMFSGAISAITVAGLVALFYVGSVAMRSAGCMYNDVLDRKIDRLVERTKNRPIASGRVSVFTAALLTGLMLLVGALVLLALDETTRIVALCVIPLVAVYPLMKRVMGAPQIVLGLAFNWGVLVGWSSTGADIFVLPLLFLYAAGVFWTLGYDTVYACQDLESDQIAGVRSMAATVSRLHPSALRPTVAAMYAVCIVCLGLSFFYAGLNLWALASLAPAAVHFMWQVSAWRSDDAHSSLKIFRANAACGWLITAGIVVANFGGRF